MIEITSNVKDVSASLSKLADSLYDEVVKQGIHSTLPLITNGARRVHRHIRRTGTLERSIKNEKTKDGGIIYANDASCDYGKYVHMGQRSWKPDQFIFESYDRNENILDQNINKAIDDTLRKAGL